jgi:hypothetical protein
MGGGGQKMSMDFTERAKNTRNPEFRQGELAKTFFFFAKTFFFRFLDLVGKR